MSLNSRAEGRPRWAASTQWVFSPPPGSHLQYAVVGAVIDGNGLVDLGDGDHPHDAVAIQIQQGIVFVVRLNALAGEQVPGEGILCNGGVVGQGGLHLSFVGFGRSLADSLLIVA